MINQAATTSIIQEQDSTTLPDELQSDLVPHGYKLKWFFIRFSLLRLWLILRYFKNPLKVPKAIRQLNQLRSSVLGDYFITKVFKSGNKYFTAMNGPAIFTKGFNHHFTHEIDRIYHKKNINGLRVALMALTKKCSYRCEHCYEWNALNQKENLSIDQLIAIVKNLQRFGVGQIQFGGGEPLNRFQSLIEVLEACQGENIFTIVTSGYQLTEQKAVQLKKSGLDTVTISLDHYKEDQHNRFRGNAEAYYWAINAAKNVKKAGMLLNLSLCVTREMCSEENLMNYLLLAKRLGAAFIWFIEPKAVGHYAGMDVSLSLDQQRLLENFSNRINFDPEFRDYPAISYADFLSRKIGCQGGGFRFLYIDTDGQIRPCPMCQSTAYGHAASTNLSEAIAQMQSRGCGVFKSVS